MLFLVGFLLVLLFIRIIKPYLWHIMVRVRSWSLLKNKEAENKTKRCAGVKKDNDCNIRMTQQYIVTRISNKQQYTRAKWRGLGENSQHLQSFQQWPAIFFLVKVANFKLSKERKMGRIEENTSENAENNTCPYGREKKRS